MNSTATDRIEKHVVLRAPRSRVWQALTESDQFGRWFGARLTGPFREGEHITGRVTHPGYEHIPFELTIERMEPERVFAWRWHVLVDPQSAQVSEATTLVTFELQEVDGGTLLTVVESGFDALPASLRDAADRGNEGGWEQQMASIERYLAEAA